MTVDDGSTLDSRQPVIGDPGSHVTRMSLATSWLWWSTAASVVNPILDIAEDDSFALVIGNRAVVELRSDGTLRRTLLRSLLSGGTTTVELIRTNPKDLLPDGFQATTSFGFPEESNAILGTIGFDVGKRGCRWRFLKGNEYYLTQAGPAIGATVIVDTSDSLTGLGLPTAIQFPSLQGRRLYDEHVVLVMPHTHATEKLIRGYLAWTHDSRRVDYEAAQSRVPREWDPTAPPDPLTYTCPVPLQADFKVTGFVQAGEWRDPSDLEAARSLLQARYDLRIGIWDLVRNPVLRRTLLDSVPVSAGPTVAAEIPRAAAERANRRVAEKMAEREAESKALVGIAKRLKSLHKAGWTEDVRRPGVFRRYVGEPIARWPGSDPVPLLEFYLSIGKKQSSVSVFFRMSNQLDLDTYMLARQETFERIAAPAECVLQSNDSHSQTLWRSPTGWADEIDWEHLALSITERTERWIAEFNPLLDDCRRYLEEMEQTRKRQAEDARKAKESALATQWEQDFAALKAFVAREGHARVPRDHIENGTNLYTWWFHQMNEYRRGRLTASQVERLEALPAWSWDQLSAYWEKRFADLEAFVAREGHARVPRDHVENGASLGFWVLQQRRAFEKKDLLASRVARFERMPGWSWTGSLGTGNDGAPPALGQALGNLDRALRELAVRIAKANIAKRRSPPGHGIPPDGQTE